MGKFAILLCAASTAFALLVFLLPQALKATPAAPKAQAGAVALPQVPGVVDLFQAEKAAAPRQFMPMQF